MLSNNRNPHETVDRPATVTIIMATYNRAHFIMETLLSIQNQTFHDFECLIIDDGGTDNTQEVIQPILDSDNRFSFLKRPNKYRKGLPGCRNYGLDTAKGNYVIFFDDDDIVHPQNLERCISELKDDGIDFCRYRREVFIDNFEYNFEYSEKYDRFKIGSADIEQILKNELPINSCAVMWKKNCFLNDRFEEHLMYAEEWELYSRIISGGLNGISIEKTLFYGRKHANSNTGEYYSDNPVRRKSYADAVLLVVENLYAKKLLSDEILRHLIVISLSFAEYRLFEMILQKAALPLNKRIQWHLYYFSLPLLVKAHGLKKKIVKRLS